MRRVIVDVGAALVGVLLVVPSFGQPDPVPVLPPSLDGGTSSGFSVAGGDGILVVGALFDIVVESPDIYARGTQ